MLTDKIMSFCKYSLCGNAQQILSEYCYSHKCELCRNVIVNYSKYCKIHKCIIPVCEHGNTYGSIWCYNHYKYIYNFICPYPLCDRITGCGEYNEIYYCDNHKCKKGGYDRCKKPIMNRFLYCEDHKCVYDSCPDLRYENKLYCSSHKCLICDNIRESDSLYCDTHKCAHCNEYKICKYHTCIICKKGDNCGHIMNKCITCNVLLQGDKKYCARHTCVLCSDSIADGKQTCFCVNHKCIKCDRGLDCPDHERDNIIRYADYVIDGLPKDIHSIIISYL
jgi:hypothetical protein